MTSRTVGENVVRRDPQAGRSCSSKVWLEQKVAAILRGCLGAFAQVNSRRQDSPCREPSSQAAPFPDGL